MVPRVLQVHFFLFQPFLLNIDWIVQTSNTKAFPLTCKSIIAFSGLHQFIVLCLIPDKSISIEKN